MFNDYIKTIPQFILPKLALTRFAALLANVRAPAIKNHLIHNFIRKYQVDLSEAREENPENYASFNEFFIRQLKPDCRPLAQAPIVSPVDGFISELGHINTGQILQAKGRYYSVDEFLACDKKLSAQFNEGSFITLYLSPKDYHRIHMPIDATLKNMIYVPGKLFSVQPRTARVVPQLFARNERLVAFFETELGLMAMVLVGATIVGAIGTNWTGEIKRAVHKEYFNPPFPQPTPAFIRQGEEMGYFKLGSTVVLLFAHPQQLAWKKELVPGQSVRFGQALASES